MAQITLSGKPDPHQRRAARRRREGADFKLTDGDLKDVSLADYKGKKKILNIVPSLDHPVCATCHAQVNETAGKLANTVGARPSRLTSRSPRSASA